MKNNKKILIYLDKLKNLRDDIEDHLIEPECIKIKIKDTNLAFKQITLNLIKHDLKRLTNLEVLLWEESQ